MNLDLEYLRSVARPIIEPHNIIYEYKERMSFRSSTKVTPFGWVCLEGVQFSQYEEKDLGIVLGFKEIIKGQAQKFRENGYFDLSLFLGSNRVLSRTVAHILFPDNTVMSSEMLTAIPSTSPNLASRFCYRSQMWNLPGEKTPYHWFDMPSHRSLNRFKFHLDFES